MQRCRSHTETVSHSPHCARLTRPDSSNFRKPARPFEKERLDEELKIIGTYGLKSKREVLKVQMMLAKIRKAARELMTLDETDPRRIFEGDALLRRMVKLGLLKESQNELDYVLGLTPRQLMERRLQTVVFKRNMANSVHQARVEIRGRHFAVGKQLVNIPSFLVRVSTEPHVQLSATSVKRTGKPGRVKRKKGEAAADAE